MASYKIDMALNAPFMVTDRVAVLTEKPLIVHGFGAIDKDFLIAQRNKDNHNFVNSLLLYFLDEGKGTNWIQFCACIREGKIMQSVLLSKNFMEELNRIFHDMEMLEIHLQGKFIIRSVPSFSNPVEVPFGKRMNIFGMWKSYRESKKEGALHQWLLCDIGEEMMKPGFEGMTYTTKRMSCSINMSIHFCEKDSKGTPKHRHSPRNTLDNPQRTKQKRDKQEGIEFDDVNPINENQENATVNDLALGIRESKTRLEEIMKTQRNHELTLRGLSRGISSIEEIVTNINRELARERLNNLYTRINYTLFGVGATASGVLFLVVCVLLKWIFPTWFL